MKETSSDFMRHVNTVETKCRELGHEMQEILSKVEFVRDFALTSDGKFLEINVLMEDMR